MVNSEQQPNLTPALEDYLETIFRLIGRTGVAKVGDIARERDVRPGSVTPAMKRLDKMGLINYQQRDNIGLTPTGLVAARRVFARHQILTRFFAEILDLPPELAEQDACSAEHHLSSEALDRFARLFEYLEICPGNKEHFSRFLTCSAVQGDASSCGPDCEELRSRENVAVPRLTMNQIEPGQKGRVQQVEAKGVRRAKLLEMGILPGSLFKVVGKTPSGKSLQIILKGHQVTLGCREAQSVAVGVE